MKSWTPTPRALASAASDMHTFLTEVLDRLDRFGYPHMQHRGLEETSAGICYTIDPDARVIA